MLIKQLCLLDPIPTCCLTTVPCRRKTNPGLPIYRDQKEILFLTEPPQLAAYDRSAQ